MDEKFNHYMKQMDVQEIEEQKEIIKFQTNRKLEIQKIIGANQNLNDAQHKESEPDLITMQDSPLASPAKKVDMNRT